MNKFIFHINVLREWTQKYDEVIDYTLQAFQQDPPTEQKDIQVLINHLNMFQQQMAQRRPCQQHHKWTRCSQSIKKILIEKRGQQKQELANTSKPSIPSPKQKNLANKRKVFPQPPGTNARDKFDEISDQLVEKILHGNRVEVYTQFQTYNAAQMSVILSSMELFLRIGEISPHERHQLEIAINYLTQYLHTKMQEYLKKGLKRNRRRAVFYGVSSLRRLVKQLLHSGSGFQKSIAPIFIQTLLSAQFSGSSYSIVPGRDEKSE